MKLSQQALYLVFFLSLLSCQSQESSEQQAAPAAVPPADTASAPATATPDSTYLILPGESIGKVKLGMPGSELTSILGKPDSTDAAMGKALLYWLNGQHYLVIYTVADFGGQDERPKVQQVQVNSPQFQTPDGIGTGKALPEIRQKYGRLKPLAHYQDEQQQQVYIFDAQQQGIAFEVTLPDSLCTAITIHPKGQNVTDTYLPLHPDMTRLE
ncbi:hypothetical protein [Pontibacter litorisediminis]|uniref:hypothetical protein n=1 Tax=Pontibacter litorisediminis TaxID=1846260 RepID=UPI0023EC9F75|nr:hypothetical protein [Pontibacter litorisediminis]